MNVICIVAEILSFYFGNICEVFIFAGSYTTRVGILLGFFVSFLSKVTSNNIISFSVYGEVERYRFELGGAAALYEYDIVILRYAEQLTKEAFSFVVYLLVRLGTMAHFHNAHTGALVIEHLAGDFLQYRFRQPADPDTEKTSITKET